MITPFVQSLMDIRAEHEGKLSAFKATWKDARHWIVLVFKQAPDALNDAEAKHENGDTSTLHWRGGHIGFKADEHQRKIIRSVSTGEPDELYDPELLTREKIEDEVRAFVRSVLGVKEQDSWKVVK